MPDPDPDLDPSAPPLPTVLAAALVAWLCASTTLAVLTLGEWLHGIRGLLALGCLLALSATPFAVRPRSPWTAVGYLIASTLACLAIPIAWALRVA